MQLLLVLTVKGANIKGQIITNDGSSDLPLVNTSVDLYLYDQAKNEWVVIAQTITNTSGSYFFYDIVPGKYYLQVNQDKNFEITVPQTIQSTKNNLSEQEMKKSKSSKSFHLIPTINY